MADTETRSCCKQPKENWAFSSGGLYFDEQRYHAGAFDHSVISVEVANEHDGYVSLESEQVVGRTKLPPRLEYDADVTIRLTSVPRTTVSNGIMNGTCGYAVQGEIP